MVLQYKIVCGPKNADPVSMRHIKCKTLKTPLLYYNILHSDRLLCSTSLMLACIPTNSRGLINLSVMQTDSHYLQTPWCHADL